MKVSFAFLCLLLPAAVFGASDVRQVSSDWMFSTTNVSTKNVTAIPATAFPGRYRITCENTDKAYSVAIGTFSTMVFSNGFVILSTVTPVNLSINLPSGKVVYGLGQSNNSQGTVAVNCLEFK